MWTEFQSTQPIHIWQIGCIISALHIRRESYNGIGFEWELSRGSKPSALKVWNEKVQRAHTIQ